jgi:uncharacterized protein YndB with AHSA1/START domain
MTTEEQKPVGKTRCTGWQIGVRRTFSISLKRAWELITSPAGTAIWLGAGPDMMLSKGAVYELPDGTIGQVRVLDPDSHLRLTWHPPGWPRPSTIQVRVIPKGEKSVISFHQEHLPDSEARQARRAFFKKALDELQELIRID